MPEWFRYHVTRGLKPLVTVCEEELKCIEALQKRDIATR